MPAAAPRLAGAALSVSALDWLRPSQAGRRAKVALDGRRQQPLQLRALKPDDGTIFRHGLAFSERLDRGAPIAAAVILFEDAKPIGATKHDVVPAVGELLDVRHHA